MVIVTEPPKIKTNGTGVNGNGRRAQIVGGGSGNDGRRRDGGGGDNRSPQPEHDPKRAGYRIGMSLMLVGISLMFGALTIAYLSLVGSRHWRPIALPPLLWLSTALILVSSLTFEAAQRAWRQGAMQRAQRWLLATMLLGTGFVASQLICWRWLVAEGLYVASNPHSSFFYILTGLHALHIVGGIAALGYLLLRVRRERRSSESGRNRAQPEMLSGAAESIRRLPQAAIEAGALYWHFVDALWVYLFMLLFLWN